jgi:hypothetical protein
MSDDRSIGQVAARVDVMRARQALRDVRAAEVRAVRHGDFDAVAPGLFSDEWPRPIVANRIDVMAKHASAALSPLPIISCESITSTSDRARAFADTRSKVANHYCKRSRLQAQMQRGADQFYSYGLIVTSVEPDVKSKFPHIFIEDSIGFYPVWDRQGRTVEIARVFTREPIELMAEFPESAADIADAVGKGNSFAPQQGPLEIIKYVCADRIVMFFSKYGKHHILIDMPNPLGRCTYVATAKPGLDDEIRGTFDDLIWVQLALHAMQTYTLSAAAQAVEAPIAVPNDVIDVPTGPGAIIHSNTPEQIRRIALDVPQSAFQTTAYLSKEIEYGAITPEALGGSIDASVVTGKGVQQLMAGYSQQIAMCQETLVGHFEQVISLCFELDEKFWPNDSKTIQGVADSTPYKLTYRAARDIHGDYTVQVAYGGVAGLDPNRGLVFLLQALGGDLVSKDYVRRHLPSDINPQDEESKITIEKLRGSLVEGMSALVQSMPAMVAAGQDPSSIISATVAALTAVQKGERLEDALARIFPPPKAEETGAAEQNGPPDETGAGEQQADPNAPPGTPGAKTPGFTPQGLPSGLTAGIASRGQGARPDLQTLFAGMSAGGKANLQGGVSRYLPAGGGL